MVMDAHSSWDVDALLSRLQGKYAASARQGAWESEEDGLRSILIALGVRLARYDQPSIAGVGGLGVVLKVHDRLLNGQACAVKFPRPKQGSQELFAEMIDKEIARLSEIRHSGVVRIHAADTLPDVPGLYAPLPFYIMDFVEGESSLAYLENTDHRELVALTVGTVEALSALHHAGMVHCDIKPDNIMVNAEHRAVITDLGTTKVLRPEDDTETHIGVTRGYAAREVLDHVEVMSETDADNYSGLIPRSSIRPRWDLVCLGKTILAWLGYDRDSGTPSPATFAIPSYTRKYLLLAAARLLGTPDSNSWLEREVSLPSDVLGEFAYQDIDELGRDLAKLSGHADLSAEIPELDPFPPDAVQLSTGAATAFTTRVRALIEHPSVRRLGSITQLGIVNQVYVTATHTRLEHSLGTYSNTAKLVRSLYYDPYSPFFRQVMRTQDLEAILALALLHDTGQFPLAHDLEEVDGSLFDHKRLTRAVLQGERNPKKGGYKPIDFAPLEPALSEWDVSTDRLIEILDIRLDRYGGKIRDRILHSVIDGAIDADKLDYLKRDSSRLGVPYGLAVDDERIVAGVTTIVTPNPAGNYVACVGVHEKARVAAEYLTIARSAMFSQVYWHHAVRAMKAMLARAVMRITTVLDVNEQRRWAFLSEFERFVVALPEALYPSLVQLEIHDQTDLGSAEKSSTQSTPSTGWARESVGTLSETDAAVLVFLEEFMRRDGVRDYEILRDLRNRFLYKRLYVWALGENDIGDELAALWTGLSARQKLEAYETLEAEIVSLVRTTSMQGAETLTLSAAAIDRVGLRLEGHLPILLVDVPASRHGAEIPLYFVHEGERRMLRKDGSAVGRALPSATWTEYAGGLRAKAGKMRVFCHPDVVETVEAAVPRELLQAKFESACNDVASRN
jgi:serine/threonine protein kinase